MIGDFWTISSAVKILKEIIKANQVLSKYVGCMFQQVRLKKVIENQIFLDLILIRLQACSNETELSSLSLHP